MPPHAYLCVACNFSHVYSLWISWRGMRLLHVLVFHMSKPASACDKAKLFAENFSKNSNLDESGIFLPVFHSRTNLKLHNISITPKMVKKVIANLSSKVSGPYCFPVVVLKNSWVWTFIHISWTLQAVSERVLFSRLLDLIGGPCI